MKKYMKHNEKIFFLCLILLDVTAINTSELSEIGAHLIFNIRKEREKNNQGLSDEEYMRQIMSRQLYSKFNIGIPSQRIKFYYETNYYESMLTEDDYDKIRSTTYKLIDNRYKNLSFKNNDFTINDTKGYLSQELFEIGKDKYFQNFTFLLKGKSISGKIQNFNILGLGINNKENEELSFINQLKKQKYIDKKIFTFLFGDNTIRESRSFDGQILIGCLPHEINSVFDERDLKWIKVKSNDNKKNWNIKFDVVKYNNDILNETIVDLDLSLSIIVGPEYFRQKLLNEFFKKNIEKNVCKENIFFNLKNEEFYIFYSCNNEAEFIEIPQLSFYNKELNETFIFSFSSLFTRHRQNFFFNIIFHKKPQNNWVFGQLFFDSYRFVFDLDEERIGYYKSYPQKDRPMIAVLAFIVAFAIFGILYMFGYIKKAGSEYDIDNDNNKKQNFYYVRKEYSDYNKNVDEQKTKKEGNTKEKIN
jgi:hypothetical protein